MENLNIIIIFTFLLFSSNPIISQSDGQDSLEDVLSFQKEMNEHYSDSTTSPLMQKDLVDFNGLSFFDPNPDFIVDAKFIKSKNQVPFEMKTTTSRKPSYKRYGKVIFRIMGKKYKLYIYQNQRLIQTKLYANHLFLPFTDLTNGEESYGGGRYIDLKIPLSNEITIDFNQSYNPYCCYNPKYSCPIPPKENHLNIKVTAGVKAFEDGNH